MNALSFLTPAPRLFACALLLSVSSQSFASEPAAATPLPSENCPAWLNHNIQKLRSKDTINLCELKQNKVLLIVNTASSCGFTPQFKGLEELYQTYKDKGLIIVGFPSDSFFQEHDDAEKTAEVCYINYGVTFPMVESSNVRGRKANPVFKHLAEEKGAPKWNFYKYLIGRDAEVIEWYNSRKKPSDSQLIADIEKALDAGKNEKTDNKI